MAHDQNTGSIVIGHPRRQGLPERLRGSKVDKLLRLAKDVDVIVETDRELR